MNYFLDTKFIEHARTMDLISIGIVAEDGREFYRTSSEFDPQAASAWVQAQVLPQRAGVHHALADARHNKANYAFLAAYHREWLASVASSNATASRAATAGYADRQLVTLGR